MLRSIGQEDMAALDRLLEKKNKAPGTTNDYSALLRTFFSWAEREGLHSGPNRAKHVRARVVEPRRRAYSREELGRIFEAAARVAREAKPKDLILRQAHRIVVLPFLTGMRVGELLNLKWSVVGSDSIALPRTETKARRERLIPLTPAARVLLDELGRERRDEYVLPLRRPTKPLRSTCVDHLIRKVRELSGIPDFLLHGPRHSAATVMVTEALGRGVGLADVTAVLGHAEARTTLAYQHQDLERMRRAAEALVDTAAESGYAVDDVKREEPEGGAFGQDMAHAPKKEKPKG